MYPQKNRGGGSMSETVLWSNPSPTSGFVTQAVTLSNSISNYKYIAFDSIAAAGASVDNFLRIIVSVDDVKRSLAAVGNYLVFISGYLPSSGATRAIFYINDTSITIDRCYYVGAGGANDAYCIPIRIVGLK